MWKKNHIHGYGECIYSDGKKYFGYYKMDKKNGFGIFYWPKNKYYIGFWKDGKQNGMAKFIKDNQIRYGIWKEGKKEKWFKNKEEFIINLNPTDEKYSNFFEWDVTEINDFSERKFAKDNGKEYSEETVWDGFTKTIFCDEYEFEIWEHRLDETD